MSMDARVSLIDISEIFASGPNASRSGASVSITVAGASHGPTVGQAALGQLHLDDIAGGIEPDFTLFASWPAGTRPPTGL